MKVGVIVEWLETSRGGAETSTAEFIRGLIHRGVDVEVMTRSGADESMGARWQTVDVRSRLRWLATERFLRECEAAMERRRGEFDLFHAFVPCRGADVYQPRGGTVAETIRRTAAARESGVGRVLKRLMMVSNVRERLLLSRERLWLGGLNRPMVIAISEYVVRQLREHYNCPNSHIRYILNGVHVADYRDGERERDRTRVRRSLGIGDDTFVLVSVCHNFRLKGVSRVIETISALRGNGADVCAIVVGGGDVGYWRRLAGRLGVSDRVRFVGAVERARPFMAAGDVLLHPTYYDPCSRVVLEAISMPMPVVCTRYDGSSEVLDGLGGSWVVESPGDVEGMARGIRALMDASVRDRVVGWLRGQAERVSMDRHVGEVYSLYGSLLDSGRCADSGGIIESRSSEDIACH
jgi:UDP-glucose:(heptosyl)LPS alpha-1,3-glucosyltransferase